jgi:hypothetical protein
MKEPLKVNEKLYMFCSLVCKNGWDNQRVFKTIETLE